VLSIYFIHLCGWPPLVRAAEEDRMIKENKTVTKVRQRLCCRRKG